MRGKRLRLLHRSNLLRLVCNNTKKHPAKFGVRVIFHRMFGNRMHDLSPFRDSINPVDFLKSFINVRNCSYERSVVPHGSVSGFPIEWVSPTVMIEAGSSGFDQEHLENVPRVHSIVFVKSTRQEKQNP